ncbi:hypothetical protein MAUB1S_11441 [Mycolicibacterium aubagnense]
MTSKIRVESVCIGLHYHAVFRSDGEPDQLLDGPDGKPLKFTSAFDAIMAGKRARQPRAEALAAEALTFRATSNRDLLDERARVFAKLGGASFKQGRR